jgi:NTE family protein
LRSLLGRNKSAARGDLETETGVEPIILDEPEHHTARIVVTLSLSDNISDKLITETLAKHLLSETGESVLLLRILSASESAASNGQVELEDLIDGELRLRRHLPESNGSVARLTVRVENNSHDAECVAPLLSNLSRHFDYVLVDTEVEDISMPAVLEFVIQADASYLFVHPNADDLRHFESFMDDLRSRARGNCSDISPILCLAPEERVNDQLKLNNGYAHAFVHDCPGLGNHVTGAGAFNRDIRRLAREIGRCRIGLALSAGGAKGLAHIGVIQVLEENGIEVDIIAGCSMGAYVASVWAMGCDGQTMEKLAREVEGRWGRWKLIDPAFPPRKGFIRGEAVIRRLKRTIGDAHFSDLARPLRIVATDLSTLERVVFSTGEVARAVHASAAIPGVCVPVTIDGETYIDGGVAEPLPVDVLSEMGVDQIIAVNALPPSAFLRCCREREKEEQEILRKGANPLNVVNRQVNFFANGNILDILMSAVHGSQIRVAELAGQKASVVLRPLSIDAQWHDFNHPGKYIELGRQVALQHLDELKALVRKKNSRHEHEPAQNELAAIA